MYLFQFLEHRRWKKKIPFAISPDVIYNLSPLLIATHATSNNLCTRDPVTNFGSISDVYMRKGGGRGRRPECAKGFYQDVQLPIKGKGPRRMCYRLLHRVSECWIMLIAWMLTEGSLSAWRWYGRGLFLCLDYDSLNLVCWRRPRVWDAARPVLVVGSLTNAMLIVFFPPLIIRLLMYCYCVLHLMS